MPRTHNPGHLAKHFNTQVCEAFAIDLGKHIEQGLRDNEDAASKEWLRDISAAASTLPDGELRGGKSIKDRCDAIAAVYEGWSTRGGTPEMRARHQRRMRHKVDKLADAYRRRTALLEQHADPGMYGAFYLATEKFVSALANSWSAVPRAFAKYPKPSGG
jgi:hypothetical protein